MRNQILLMYSVWYINCVTLFRNKLNIFLINREENDKQMKKKDLTAGNTKNWIMLPDRFPWAQLSQKPMTISHEEGQTAAAAAAAPPHQLV